MIEKWILKTLKNLLSDQDNKAALFKAIDKAVKDSKNPLDDKAALMFKSVYDIIVSLL